MINTVQDNDTPITRSTPFLAPPMTYHWVCLQCDVPVMRQAPQCPGCGTPQPKRV